MEQKEKPRNRRFKTIKIIILLLIIALLAGGVFLFGKYFFMEKKKEEPQEPAASIQNTFNIKSTEPDTTRPESESALDENAEPEQPDTEEEASSAKELEPYITEPVLVKNITVFPGENAVFQCYEKEAVEYKWEYYSTLDRKWWDISKKPEFILYEERDSLNRMVSCLSIPGSEEHDGLNIRCTVILPEEESILSEGNLCLFAGQIKEVTLSETEAEAGEYFSSLDIKASITSETGEDMEITGLQSLLFYVPQNEEESTTYDEEKSLTTEIHTKIYKEAAYYPVKEGEQTVPLKFHIGDEVKDLEIVIRGTDTKAPVIENLRAEYEVSNTDVKSTLVKLYASAADNYSLPSELEFAFSKDETPGEDILWTSSIPLETEVSENGVYYFLVRDKAGNIGKEKINLIAVDTKAPVIEEILLHEAGAGPANDIEVIATDKTEMEYCFSREGEQEPEWQKEPLYTATVNGKYIVRVRDRAGNISEGKIEVTNIDTTPPVIVRIYEKGTDINGSTNGFTIETVSGGASEAPDIHGDENISGNASGAYETTQTQSSQTNDIISQMKETGTSGITITSSGNGKTGTYQTGANGISGGTGIQGAKGEKGEVGAAGTSSYVHIRYSQDERGTGMTASPDKSTRYIGIYTGTSKTAPSAFSSYKWSLYQGENTHVYMKYAETSNGENMTDEAEQESMYIGFCITAEERAPTEPSEYTWSRFRENAESLYMRYSAYANGAEMTENPQENSRYIGLCTSTQKAAPTDPSMYEWSLYKGTSSFLHIRYSVNGDGTAMTDIPATDSNFIGICNSTEAAAPADPSAYTWVRLKGNDGNSSFIHVKYSEDPDGTGMTDTPNENSCFMGICISGEETAPTDTVDYQWCRISYGREMVELRQHVEVMQNQIEAMKNEIEELKDR